MKSDIASFSLQWLLSSEPHGAVPVVDKDLSIERLDYNIPSDIGEAWLERLELNGSFSLYRAVHRLENATLGQLVPILTVKNNEPENTFSAQVCLSGIECHQEYWNGRGDPARDTFRLTKKWDARVQIGGGCMTEMRFVMLPESMLLALLGESNTNQLLERLGLSKQVEAVTHPIPPYVNSPLKDAMSDKFSGPARRLFAQARVLEYLGGLVNHLFAENKSNSIHKRKIQELREYLVSLEGRLPTLSQLAKDFCLPAKQMNNEFNLEFGQSIYAFVTAHRLEQAHAILKDSNVPMKVISARLGYSHVNHFITAFKRKFAYSPGSLRKKS